MNLCQVTVTYPGTSGEGKFEPAVYRGIVGDTDAEVLRKAQERHFEAGRLFKGSQYKITQSRVVLCPASLPDAA